MPPTFRSSRSGRQFSDGPNRTRTGQIDHDVFEGLPVRRWSRQVQTVSQEPRVEGTESDAPGHAKKPSIPEHPMPRDSHLLSPMSRALLRAARQGCIYIRKASKEYDEEEKDATDADEQQSQQNLERNFSMRKWSTVPKHLETPEVEFLAKRRPGLPSLYGSTTGTVETANVPMRKTRFKKVDPVTGNISIYAAWVPEGHKIEGEIADDAQVATENTQVTVTPQAPAPGTVIEGVGVVNAQGVVVAEAGSAAVLTPPKRRPPPPKRKGKGLKGRRKKVMFAPGEGTDASLVHGAGAGVSDGTGKETDPSRMSVEKTTQDDEYDEDEEGEESDDGEGDESGFEAKTPETPGAQASTEPELGPTPGSATEPTPTPASIKSETPQLTQVPVHEVKLELGPAAESLPVPAYPVAPPAHEDAPAISVDAASSATPDRSMTLTSAAPVAEDVQMTDAMPTSDTLHTTSMAASETQQNETQQPPGPEPSNVAAANTESTTTGQPEEPMDVTMEEPNEAIPEPSRVEPESMDVSTETPQLPEQPQEKESTPRQTDQRPESNQFDLLDNLEASLGNVPKDALSNGQAESKPEQKSELPGDEAAPEHEPAARAEPPTKAPEEPQPVQPSPEETPAREDPVAPPVEQLTPPEVEQTATPDVAPETSIEQQQAEQAPEAPTEPVALPSAEPQQSEINPTQPVTEQTPSQLETKTEPSTAEGSSLQPSSSENATEKQADAKPTSPPVEQEQQAETTSEAATGSPAEPVVEATAEADTTVEPAPESTSEQSQPTAATQDAPKELSQPPSDSAVPEPMEPAAEQQSNDTRAAAAQEQGTSGDGPSANGEQQA